MVISFRTLFTPRMLLTRLLIRSFSSALPASPFQRHDAVFRS